MAFSQPLAQPLPQLAPSPSTVALYHKRINVFQLMISCTCLGFPKILGNCNTVQAWPRLLLLHCRNLLGQISLKDLPGKNLWPPKARRPFALAVQSFVCRTGQVHSCVVAVKILLQSLAGRGSVLVAIKWQLLHGSWHKGIASCDVTVLTCSRSTEYYCRHWRAQQTPDVVHVLYGLWPAAMHTLCCSAVCHFCMLSLLQ